MKLIDAAMRNIEGRERAAQYLDRELPGEDHDREITEVYSDESCTVYQDKGCSEVFFISHTGGWASTDNVEDDYLEVYAALVAAGVIDSMKTTFMRTPWGQADTARKMEGTDCIAVTTSTHGGIYVPNHLLPRIPDVERKLAAAWSGSENWFEEDCCALSVLFHIPATRKDGWTEDQVREWHKNAVLSQLGERA